MGKRRYVLPSNNCNAMYSILVLLCYATLVGAHFATSKYSFGKSKPLDPSNSKGETKRAFAEISTLVNLVGKLGQIFVAPTFEVPTAEERNKGRREQWSGGKICFYYF